VTLLLVVVGGEAERERCWINGNVISVVV